MKSVQPSFKQLWPALVLALFMVLVLRFHGGVYAAPTNQTVPPPTLTPVDTPVPTATPVPDNNNNDDNNNDNNDPAPTATPIVIPETPTPEGLTATIAVVRLNVRQGPSTEFAVLGVVANGQSVQVLARNETDDWWQICCLPGTTTPGWITAQFVQPNFDRSQAITLVPVVTDLPIPPTPAQTDNSELGNSGNVTGTKTLQLQIQQDPLFTWQGQQVDLVYEIANSGDTAALNLELRNELPGQLDFVEFVAVGGGTALTETTEFATTAFAITWPELAAGDTETIRVRLFVTDTVADGSVINNLAVLIADERDAVTAGISIGMPPQTLPDFQ